jgi:hypothetical protein
MPVRVVRWTEVVPTRTVVAGATRTSKTATEEALLECAMLSHGRNMVQRREGNADNKRGLVM